MQNPRWLEWARRLQAVAQTGLAYGNNAFDLGRYGEIRSIAAEMMTEGAGMEGNLAMAAAFAREAGYATPKTDVRAAVIEAGKVLLVREREDGAWSLPGGWADVGEAPSVAAVREVREESGYEVVARKLAAVYDRDRHGHPPIPFHAYKLFFVCELRGGAAAASVETSEAGFFGEDELPPLSLTRVTAKQIGHMFEHWRHPEWPTSFD